MLNKVIAMITILCLAGPAHASKASTKPVEEMSAATQERIREALAKPPKDTTEESLPTMTPFEYSQAMSSYRARSITGGVLGVIGGLGVFGVLIQTASLDLDDPALEPIRSARTAGLVTSGVLALIGVSVALSAKRPRARVVAFTGNGITGRF